MTLGEDATTELAPIVGRDTGGSDGRTTCTSRPGHPLRASIHIGKRKRYLAQETGGLIGKG
jgi:hypothetical protein